MSTVSVPPRVLLRSEQSNARLSVIESTMRRAFCVLEGGPADSRMGGWSLAPPSPHRLVGADARVRVRLVDPSRRAGRNERDHDRYEVDGALVSYDVDVVARIHEARSGWDHMGRAGGIVPKIER